MPVLTLKQYLAVNAAALAAKTDQEVADLVNASDILVAGASYDVTYFQIADDSYFNADPLIRGAMSQALCRAMALVAAQDEYIKLVHDRLISKDGVDLHNAAFQAGILKFKDAVIAAAAAVTDPPNAPALVTGTIAKFQGKAPVYTSIAAQNGWSTVTAAQVAAQRTILANLAWVNQKYALAQAAANAGQTLAQIKALFA